jgi:Phage tail tube protein, TTP
MGSIVGRGVRVEVASVYTQTANPVTAISLANPAVLSSVAHGFANKDVGYIDGIEGMTNIEGQAIRAKSITADTLQMEGINSLLFPAFTGAAVLYEASAWLLIAKATSYQIGGGGAEKLDDTALIDDVKQELAGLLDAQSVTIDVNAQEENDAALQLLEDAAFNQGYLIFRITFKSGATRVWRGQPSQPGENVGKGAIGTGTFTTTVKGKVVKGAP